MQLSDIRPGIEALKQPSPARRQLKVPQRRFTTAHEIGKLYFQSGTRIHETRPKLLAFPPSFSSTSLSSPPLFPNHNHDILSLDPPATATSPSSAQFRAGVVHSFHAMERPQRGYRLAITNCRRAVWEHGAGVSARRFTVSLEPGQRDPSWRGRGV